MPERAVAGVSDAELTGRIRVGDDGWEPAEIELVRRHRMVVLRYARLCCGAPEAAEDLTDEAFARAFEAVRAGRGPRRAWRPYLIAAVRQAATAWAASGRRLDLSPGFAAWLDGLPDEVHQERATTAAEENSAMLRAFWTLPELQQAALWSTVMDSVEPGESSTEPSTAPTETEAARRNLYEAYLQAYAAQASSRACRHLVAVMDDTVRRGVPSRTQELERHTETCGNCSRARAELLAVHDGQDAVLADALLLWTVGRPPVRSSTVAAGELPPGTAPSAPTPPRTNSHRSRRGGFILSASPAGVAAMLVVICAAVTVVVTTAMPTGRGEDMRGHSQFTAAHATTTVTATATATATATPTPTATATAGRRPALRPTASQPARRTTRSSTPPKTSPSQYTTASPSTESPAGFQLVNKKSGLCVGIRSNSVTDGALVQLQRCSSASTQRWERVAAGQDYRLRNMGTGKCLDGAGRGDSVRLMQWDCHSPTDDWEADQRWRFAPAGDASSYLLEFVPPVDDSAYAWHVLGPEDWTSGNPPHEGTYLAHLPNYYSSDSFVFECVGRL
ncbi:RICIN domain-containing protein [Streptomyces sp. NPDC059011]|uniref:RICIN domain-containing protein n=1 Tax=unclassified Streptomyces TaxID=2593676 RepID=UPI0036970A35